MTRPIVANSSSCDIEGKNDLVNGLIKTTLLVKKKVHVVKASHYIRDNITLILGPWSLTVNRHADSVVCK